MENSRRAFVRKALKGAAAVAIGGVLPSISARSYAAIIGANERVRVAVMGVNARGLALGSNFAKQSDCEVLYSCDVDSRASDKFIGAVEKITGKRPKAAPDFRKALEDKALDALVVAAPDHWHAPAALLAAKAGKHVYLEKPCSHNPHEGELLVAARAKYGKVMQMGNQRRSWPNVIAAVSELKAGAIGRCYFAKTWYTNNRASIGKGKETAVPSWLNYDLWQGPAPRERFRDNIIHYNWHWFWNWGTGEALNNGTHMVDVARWGLGVDYPVRVNSSGGRYHYNDDWETPDTQIINLEFANNTFISWEGRSCNGRPVEGSSVGVAFYGENGSLVIDGGNSYTIYDLKNKVVKAAKNDIEIDARNNMNPSEQLDALHIQNFFDGIRKGTALHSDIVSGHQSTLLVQLGNIAQRTGRTLNIDPKTGRIKDDPGALEYWSRKYEPGWEPSV
ncbi:Gfo/Idh/MocA family protein [Chitinophaga sp. XS-30]|uniref:Gfo/Idh/MocA family protein n=1 Tax=Chitinophaga sp. XS-30 TaxID=2604421 RepID=UPI0011DCD014|nr:Gfo/Idh/MocA family oxidoreductase [Chitinophaga sp. XS-30]QEH40945.1 Gfo/Idh/MocA family oxidoreductase [Chitinophaga sp. XS-30]